MLACCLTELPAGCGLGQVRFSAAFSGIVFDTNMQSFRSSILTVWTQLLGYPVTELPVLPHTHLGADARRVFQTHSVLILLYEVHLRAAPSELCTTRRTALSLSSALVSSSTAISNVCFHMATNCLPPRQTTRMRSHFGFVIVVVWCCFCCLFNVPLSCYLLNNLLNNLNRLPCSCCSCYCSCCSCFCCCGYYTSCLRFASPR